MDELGLLPLLAAHAGRELGVPYMLDDAPPSGELIARLEIAPRLARRLLAVLALDGRVVIGDDGRVVPGPAGWPDGPAPPAAALLGRILRRGVPLSEAEIQAHPEARMFGLLPEDRALPLKAAAAAELLAPRFREEPGWFLDVGCGVGQHALALLQRAPLARGVLVDAHPQILALATRIHAATAARVELRLGDITTVDLGSPSRRYRAALVCDVLHVLPRAACRATLARLARLLEPGGTLLIGELAPGPRATVFALSAALLGGDFDAYGADDLAGFCREAGFVGLSVEPCRGVATSVFYLSSTAGS